MRFLLLIILFATSLWVYGQTHDPGGIKRNPIGLGIKTYPMRFFYGFNAELSIKSRKGHLLSVLYQHHQSDFFSVPGRSFDFSAVPRLEPAEGYTFYLSYQFPLGDPETTNFWLGPRAGMKDVKGFTTESKYDVQIDQRNFYYLGQFTFRTKFWHVLLEAYFQTGAVNIHWESRWYYEDGSLYRENDDWTNYWLPHFLAGFAVGFEI